MVPMVRVAKEKRNQATIAPGVMRWTGDMFEALDWAELTGFLSMDS
jgi:hypothetical protein